MKRNDALWKAVIEDLADDFLTFYFPQADEILNLNRKIAFLDKELEQLFPNTQDEFSPKYVDKLMKVFTKTGKEEWILIHVEVQGSTDRRFAERMFTYFTRIRDKYNKPITALAILADKNPSFRPSCYQSEFMGTSVVYQFNMYKILDADNQALAQSNNPFASVVEVVQTALKKGRIADQTLFDLKVELTRKLLQRNFTKEKITALLRFLKLYIRFENQELNVKFEEKLEEITKRPKTMGMQEFVIDQAKRIGFKEGIVEGREEGRVEGRVEAFAEKDYSFVRSLIINTDFEDAKIVLLTGTTLAFVQKIRAEVSK